MTPIFPINFQKRPITCLSVSLYLSMSLSFVMTRHCLSVYIQRRTEYLTYIYLKNFLLNVFVFVFVFVGVSFDVLDVSNASRRCPLYGDVWDVAVDGEIIWLCLYLSDPGIPGVRSMGLSNSVQHLVETSYASYASNMQVMQVMHVICKLCQLCK